MIEELPTKVRILDAAEHLFGRDGIDATSLRAITADAGVNLAAVNYHFQSKEALIHAVIGRRLLPINRRRLELLEQYEREAAGKVVPLEKVLDAFLRPVLELVNVAPGFGPLMGKMYTEPQTFVERVFREYLEGVAMRFTPVLHKAVPYLSRKDLLWRVHFTIGVMAHTVAGAYLLGVISKGLCGREDPEITLSRMIAFITPGFQAPGAEVLRAR
jgi:AcrR family transcriptional regulator